jgi:hypothetical protein
VSGAGQDVDQASSTVTWGDVAHRQARPALWRVWVGLFGGAASWAVQLIANYALVAHFCHPKEVPLSAPAFGGTRSVVIAISAVLLAAAVASWMVAWRTWRHTAPADTAGTPMTGGGGWGHFAALAGLFVGAIFCFAIAMNAVPAFIGAVCAGPS